MAGTQAAGQAGAQVEPGLLSEALIGVGDLQCALSDEILRTCGLDITRYVLLRACCEQTAGLSLRVAGAYVPLTREECALLLGSLETYGYLYQVREAGNRRSRAWRPTTAGLQVERLAAAACEMRLAARFDEGAGGSVGLAILARLLGDVCGTLPEPDAVWGVTRGLSWLSRTCENAAHSLGAPAAPCLVLLAASSAWPDSISLGAVRALGMRQSTLLALVPLCELDGLVEIDDAGASGTASGTGDPHDHDEVRMRVTEEGRILAEEFAMAFERLLPSEDDRPAVADTDRAERFARLAAALSLA